MGFGGKSLIVTRWLNNLVHNTSSDFSRMKSSKSLEDKLSILGDMISLVSKQNEELADQISKSTK